MHKVVYTSVNFVYTGLSMGSCADLRDERRACQLLPISVHETDQETLEYKRAYAARTGDHLCVVLNG